VACPYTPDRQQEWKIDFPRLMLRSLALQAKKTEVQRGARLLARTDLQGKVATAMSGLVNMTNDGKPVRFLMEKTTGIARNRLLPTFAKVRFSKWFRTREQAPRDAPPTKQVALFPTCLVEYQEPDIGKATVGVCERNGIACELPDGQVCCGMPWLDAGDVGKFEVGKVLQAGDVFKAGDVVDAVGVTKGKGYQGVIKRHKMGGFRATHGTQVFLRHGGSIGCRLTPGRTQNGNRLSGHIGMDNDTAAALVVVHLLQVNVVLVKCAGTGARNGLVLLKGSSKDVKKYVVPRPIKEIESKNPMKASKKGASSK
jgi:hypothetical protein